MTAIRRTIKNPASDPSLRNQGSNYLNRHMSILFYRVDGSKCEEKVSHNTLLKGIFSLASTLSLLIGVTGVSTAQPTLTDHAASIAHNTQKKNPLNVNSPTRTKVYWTTVTNQWSHWTPDANTSSHAGTLNQGSNYFYCWTGGQVFIANSHNSDIWLLTDDDSGNKNVWVSAVYLTDYAYLHYLNTTPNCN